MSSCNCNHGPGEFTSRDVRIPRPTKKCEINGVLFNTITIPSNLGTDAKGQPYAPKDGLYYNKLVRYEANGVVVLYDSRGVYTYLVKNTTVGVASVNGKAGIVTLTLNDLENDAGYQTAEEVAQAIEDAISSLDFSKPYLSLKRDSEYLYTVTFGELPEENNPVQSAYGGCSAFVRDGKLYRNLDWNYDDNASFHIITKDFEGMSFVGGLTSSNLDDDLIAQLPYRVTDGVNRHGIMVSTHILYNDWEWAGTGTIPLTKLPFLVLENVKSMATIATDLGDTLSDLYVPEAMVDLEYLIQVLVTDGTTTYILSPSTTTGTYELIDATANPKLTNFRWVADTTVVRTSLQDRPTGVERWNEIDAEVSLADLRFTKAYEAPTRLSEFIGINGTTKDSTDAELTAIYTLAHDEYEDRERDGKTWQTMHSVVYGANGIESLSIQEDWSKDYTYVTKDYVDNAVANKVDKVADKQLSTEDYTTAEKTKLEGLENYDDTAVRNLINTKANSSDFTHETWTFTLADSTTVTKEVTLWNGD